jgi:hypothetical protein
MTQSDVKTKLIDYLLNAPKKDGQYVISSKTILEMAKEELIKRGELVDTETIQNAALSEFKDQLTDYFQRSLQKKSPTNYWYLLSAESILEMAKDELIKEDKK